MKLIYFHGFASSGASGTVQLLRRLLPSAEVIAPDIPVDPAEALPTLVQLVASERPDLIIGTSMGGMYAQQMHGFLRICVNPSFHISRLSKIVHTGEHLWLNGRKDGEKSSALRPRRCNTSTRWSEISLTVSPLKTNRSVSDSLVLKTKPSTLQTPSKSSKDITIVPNDLRAVIN